MKAVALHTARTKAEKGCLERCIGGTEMRAHLLGLARGGFMPQARHGGNGVWALVALRSKLDGTGFEKEQIGQTQVALLAGIGSGGGK